MSGMIAAALLAVASPAGQQALARDVIVNAPPVAPEKPQTRVEAAPVLSGRDPDKTATYADAARRAARCAVKGRIVSLSLLRAVVDGAVPSPAQTSAQRRLVRQTAACGEGAAVALLDVSSAVSPSTGYNAPETFLHLARRGAFVAEALNAFAPDLALSSERLNDPAVRQRFVARETPLARNRQPQDLTYFRVAICLVREQPALAIRLVRTDPVTASTLPIQAQMIERARGCVGNVRRVVVDRYEFRWYIADALYRWAVAERGTATLIPATVEEADRLRSLPARG